MKKIKRILAVIGIIILAGLYLSTLIFAIIGSDDAMNWFKASVYATVVLPVLIWAYGLIYRLLKNHYALREDTAKVSSNEKPQTDSENTKNQTTDNTETLPHTSTR